jgi:hypothetical protein
MQNHQYVEDSMDGNWYRMKPYLLIIGSCLLWVVSFIMFVVGLKFNRPLMFGNWEVSLFVASVMSITLTVIQISFNDADMDEKSMMFYVGLASYVLGIFADYNGISQIMSIEPFYMKSIVSLALAFIVEVSPEFLLLNGLSQIRRRTKVKARTQYPTSIPRRDYDN